MSQTSATTVRHELAALRSALTSTPRRSRSCPPRRFYSDASFQRPKTAIFFPGQGVQRVGMTSPWLDAFPRTVKPILEEIDDILGIKLSSIIASGTNAELNATEHSQPAIMATSIMILRILEQEFGFATTERVDFTLGHSLGEFAALVAGGYMNFADALTLVSKRGQVMADCSRKAAKASGGEVGMVAMMCETEEHLNSLVKAIREFTQPSLNAGAKQDSAEDAPPVQQVVIANINSKNQIVLSGNISHIKTLMTHLRQFGGHDPRHVRLNSDSPFHSPLMQPAQDFMKKILNSPSQRTGEDMIKFPGVVPCISNVSGRPFKSREDIKDLLARQTTETVKWWSSVRFLDQQEHVRRWIGIGPGKVGRNLVGKEVGMKGSVKGGGVWGITSPAEMEEVMKALDATESSTDAMPAPPAPSAAHTFQASAAASARAYTTMRLNYYNPAIVQRLWPPPQSLSGIEVLTAEINQKTAGSAFPPPTSQSENLQSRI